MVGVAILELRREAIREDTTRAAEDERPDPVGTVPLTRIFIVGIGGFLI